MRQNIEFLHVVKSIEFRGSIRQIILAWMQKTNLSLFLSSSLFLLVYTCCQVFIRLHKREDLREKWFSVERCVSLYCVICKVIFSSMFEA